MFIEKKRVFYICIESLSALLLTILNERLQHYLGNIGNAPSENLNCVLDLPPKCHVPVLCMIDK